MVKPLDIELQKGFKVVQDRAYHDTSVTAGNAFNVRFTMDDYPYRSVWVPPWCRPQLYGVGEKTFRPHKCGPLAVFEDRQFARLFMTEFLQTNRWHIDGYHLFTCFYAPSRAKRLWVPIKHEWGYRTHAMKPEDQPEGTVTADWVELIEEVPWDLT